MGAETPRYTESQILCGLRETWFDITGAYDTPFDADTQIDLYLKADGTWHEFDLEELCKALEEFFGFKSSDTEWTQLFRLDVTDAQKWESECAPHITFGALARFIAQRTEAISLAPTTILGRRCAPAGAFLGIRRVAERLRPATNDFAPSAPIIATFRGRSLNRLWTQLRWMTNGQLMQLPARWRDATFVTYMWCFLISVLAWGVTCALGDYRIAGVAVGGSIIAILIAEAYHYFHNPLPGDVATFRDLANRIASFSDEELDTTNSTAK
jgi:hypothetical protein